MSVDFNSMTAMDIRDLIREANEALQSYNNREKTKVYANFIPFDGWRYYLKEENAKSDLLEAIEDGIYGDDEYKVKCFYLTDAELEYCQDYEQFKQ